MDERILVEEMMVEVVEEAIEGVLVEVTSTKGEED